MVPHRAPNLAPPTNPTRVRKSRKPAHNMHRVKAKGVVPRQVAAKAQVPRHKAQVKAKVRAKVKARVKVTAKENVLRSQIPRKENLSSEK